MRRLFYVPIFHDAEDMGSTGAALARLSRLAVGERRWRLHQECLERFWQAVAAYLGSLDARWLKLYQDGLPVGGEAARHVVEEAARRGSRNYQVVLELLSRGAEAVPTEDPRLLLQERALVLRGVQAQAAGETPSLPGRDRAEQDRLLAERDRSIAETIAATLKEGESGVLFLGAYHAATSHLPADITIVSLKDRSKVLAYFCELLRGQDEGRLRELAGYLASPVSIAPQRPSR